MRLSLCLFLQICSQLSERLEKQQTANKVEIEKIRVSFPLPKSFCSVPASSLCFAQPQRFWERGGLLGFQK